MRSTLAQTKELLRRFDLRARKGLGQHFLVNEEVLGRILSAAELSPADTVVEVGPGLGVLTHELVRRARRVIAIEMDSRLASALTQIFVDSPNLSVLNADVLQVDPEALFGGEARSASPFSYKVIANIPYYITSPILRHFLEASLRPSVIVVMVQREVAQSIAAGPGEMNLLSVGIQFYGKPSLVGYVSAESFYPRPKVDSAIVRIDVYPRPVVEVRDVEGFFAVVRAGFCAPRKQLRNALAQGLSLLPSEAAQLLQRAEVDSRRRAETMTLEEWARLYQAFSERGEGDA